MLNIDTVTAITLISESSPERHDLRQYIVDQGGAMVMTETALREFNEIVRSTAGPRETGRAERFLSRVLITLDNPSDRVMNLRETRNLETTDKIILGTGDRLGLVTITADSRAVRACRAQGVHIHVHEHKPVPLTGA